MSLIRTFNSEKQLEDFLNTQAPEQILVKGMKYVVKYSDIHDYITGTIDGPTNVLNDLPISIDGFYDPQVVYYNNKTYFASLSDDGNATQKPVVVCVDEDGNASIIVINDVLPSYNYHNMGTIAINSSGYIYIIMAQHGLQGLIYKSDNPEDISSFTKLAEKVSDIAPNNLNYPQLHKDYQDNYRISHRYLLKRMSVYTASNGLEGWSAKVDITADSIAEEGSDPRHYPLMIYNNLYSNYNYILLGKREVISAVATFIRYWVFKTQDWETFSNVQDTFSKDVVGTGVLTEAELNTNCLIHLETDFSVSNGDDVQGYINPLNGNIYIGMGRDGVYTLYTYNGTSWSNKTIDIIPEVVEFYSTYWEVWTRVYNGGNNLNELTKYRTTDELSNIEKIRVIKDYDTGIRNFKIPHIWSDIPNDKVFTLGGSGYFKNIVNIPASDINNDFNFITIKKGFKDDSIIGDYDLGTDEYLAVEARKTNWTGQEKSSFDKFIGKEVANGNYALCDEIFVLTGNDQLIGFKSKTAINEGVVTFDGYGAIFDGTNYLRTQFFPHSDHSIGLLEDCRITVYVYTNDSGSFTLSGTYDSNTGATVLAHLGNHVSTGESYTMNSASNPKTGTQMSGNERVFATRKIEFFDIEFFRNGVYIQEDVANTVRFPEHEYYIGGLNLNNALSGGFVGKISAVSYGKAINYDNLAFQNNISQLLIDLNA